MSAMATRGPIPLPDPPPPDAGPPDAGPFLQVTGLAKSYGAFTALHPTDLSVARGEVFGLLGPNGAGKSTLIRTLMGFLAPTAGEARICGFRCDRDRLETHRRTAYLPGEVRLFRGFTGRGVLDFFCKLRGDASPARANRVAERLQVDLARRVAACSSGMRQKLALSVVLSAQTPLIILDEPTTHLDPTARLEVLQLVREVRDDGRTVLFSSHVFSEVEDVCDRAALLRAGRIVERPIIADLRRRHRVTAVATGRLTPYVGDAARGLEITIQSSSEPGPVQIDVHGEFAKALGWLSQQPLSEVRIVPFGLQQVYEAAHGVGETSPDRTN